MKCRNLIAGTVGLSIDEGKAIMASLQRNIIERLRSRLWNGQTDRAIDLIGRLFQDLKADERGSTAIARYEAGC